MTTIDGDYDPYTSDKYQGQRGVTPSRLFKELNRQGLYPGGRREPSPGP